MKKLVLGMAFVLFSFVFIGSIHASAYTTGTTSTGYGPFVSQTEFDYINTAIGGIGIPEDPEFVEALAWMYNNKITGLGTPGNYRPFDKITREEATKILGRFAKGVLGLQYKPEIANSDCLFVDSGAIASGLTQDVFDACKLGLFRGDKNGFFPKGGLTKAQSLVVLIRLFDNRLLPENAVPWFKYYYERAFELGITKDRDLTNFDRNLTRYEIALMIYRFNIKYKLAKKYQGQVLSPNQLLGILPESITSSGGLKKGDALFNTEVLTNPGFESFPIDLFGDKYVIKKVRFDNYGVGNSNFSWLGNLYTADEKTFLGSSSFIILNGAIDEAYVRPTELGGKYYKISPSSKLPYYTVEEMMQQ